MKSFVRNRVRLGACLYEQYPEFFYENMAPCNNICSSGGVTSWPKHTSSSSSSSSSNSKSKAIPLEAWLVPEGSRSLRLPDFKAIGT